MSSAAAPPGGGKSGTKYSRVLCARAWHRRLFTAVLYPLSAAKLRRVRACRLKDAVEGKAEGEDAPCWHQTALFRRLQQHQQRQQRQSCRTERHVEFLIGALAADV